MTILHIDSSINGENSASRAISAARSSTSCAERSGASVVYRDLAAEPLPHLTLDAFADTSVLDEFLAADTVVIGAPMYNFTLPTQLKAWIDRILVAGKTFRYTENGPEGLAGGKRVIIALARGGFYDAGPAGGRARASRELSARRLQLHRHRARIRRRRRARDRSRAARPLDQAGAWRDGPARGLISAARDCPSRAPPRAPAPPLPSGAGALICHDTPRPFAR